MNKLVAAVSILVWNAMLYGLVLTSGNIVWPRHRATIALNERGCYCGLWGNDPAYLVSRGVPPGYCGHCQRCGEPGHTRHFPGGVP